MSSPVTVIAEVGRLCVEAVLRRMRQEGPERGTTPLPARLVLRDTTAPPAP
ncbi:hypothetical protein GCM10020256_74190 [Streptomyces thermocoprophilus]